MLDGDALTWWEAVSDDATEPLSWEDFMQEFEIFFGVSARPQEGKILVLMAGHTIGYGVRDRFKETSCVCPRLGDAKEAKAQV